MENISFEEMLNDAMKDQKIGKTVTGTVINITANNEIFVDIGYKADGIIPITEYSFEENANPKEEFKPGDTITADVLKMNDGVGNVLLSYKRNKLKNAKRKFEEKVKNHDIFEGIVTEVIEKGLIIYEQGIRIFIPLSLSGISKSEELTEYKGKKVHFYIVEFDEKTHRIIGSIKAVNDEEKQKQLKKFWEQVEDGKEYIGIVTSISTYGAFVDIGGVQGLLHISEMTWGRNQNPQDILQVGQEIKVTVLNVDKENKRIKLTYEGKGPDPWEKVDKNYKVQDIVTVKIVKIMPFGVFVELEKGIEGLVHISQICEKKIAKPEEVLTVNQKVNAKIIELDKENKRIELSIRDVEGTSNELI